MRRFSAAVIISVLAVCLTSTVFANGISYRTPKKSITLRAASRPCVSKPISEYIEDGLAMALDIPLALMSPVLCPILGPVIDAVDPVHKKSFPRRGSRK